MSLREQLRALPIAARSFLLVLAALVVAEGIALALFALRPAPRGPFPPAHEMSEMRPPPEPRPGFETAPPPGFQPGPPPERRAEGPRAPGPGNPPPKPTGLLQRQALLLFALGLMLLLPLAWLFARALAAPIRRFAEGARRLGQDPFAPPLPRSGPLEMRQAVDAFNAMQSRLHRLLQERTQMVGAIAHDLRTPLTRLAFRLEDLPSPLREKVQADIQEMKSMIAAALDFLRDRALTGQREPLDLRLLVERIVDDHADLGHDVTLAEGGPVTVHGAPLALRRMIVNLVENALKYGERARLRLRLEREHAVIEIDDDGPGIPESHQEQVFEPFFRLEGSRNRDTGGIGLGLATARAIALDHGGDIQLANRKGGGLRVTVQLPLPGPETAG